MTKLSKDQVEATRQKEYVLESGNKVGYATIPHDIYRVVLPDLNAKYDGRVARDCIILYGYFHAYTHGTNSNDEYLWAYPTVDQIVEDTGVKRNRIKPLVDVLEAEGLVITRKIPWNGNTKKLYMPLYLRGEYRASTVKDTEVSTVRDT